MNLNKKTDNVATHGAGVSSGVTIVDVGNLQALNSIKVSRCPWDVTILPSQNVPAS